MRAPRKPQTSLPAAPPAKTSVSAIPTVGRPAFRLQEKRQESQESRAGGTVDNADREQQREAAVRPGGSIIYGMVTDRCRFAARRVRAAEQERDRECGRDADRPEGQHSAAPGHEQKERRGRGGERHFSEVAGKVVHC